MKRLARDQANKLFDRYWDGLRQEWFKLEVLQDYTSEDDGPSLRAWLSGDKQKALEALESDDNLEFSRMCQQKLAEGVKLLRIHVLEEPLTPYMIWELEFYRKISIPRRGESVLVIDKSEIGDLNLPVGDLMIFDQKFVVVNDYENSRMTHQTFYGPRDDLSHFLALRKALKSRARPLL